MDRNNDVETIASHFASFFKPDVSNAKSSVEASFAIRHLVYAEELKLEPENQRKLETDEFDAQSIHCFKCLGNVASTSHTIPMNLIIFLESASRNSNFLEDLNGFSKT